MLVAPAVDLRISRRCASSPRKNLAGLCVAGLLQDTATNSEVIACGASSRCQVAVFTASRVGRGSKCSVRAARLAVEPVIVQRHIGRTEQFAGTDAAARTLFAAHLEQIGKVVIEQQRQGEARGVLAVVLHADALIGRSAPQEDRAHDVQHVLLQHDPAIADTHRGW